MKGNRMSEYFQKKNILLFQMNEDILKKLDSIEKILVQVNNRLNQIDNHLGIVKEDCNKMGDHIDFIEKTYSLLRQPLNYVTRAICKRTTDLPQIPQIKNIEQDK